MFYLRQSIITVLIAGAALTATAVPVSAKGMVVVTQSNGSQKVYRNVFIRVRESAMSLTSGNGETTLMIGKTACTEVGHLSRCIASDATLTQFGESRPVHLGSGTAWLDLSAKPYHLRLSFQTKAGATVTASGAVDEFER